MNEERNYVVEKKKSPILTFMVILTCVVIIGTCIYFIYNSIKLDNDNSNKEENNVNSSEIEEDNIATEEEQELEVTEEEKNNVKKLINVIDSSLGSLSIEHNDFIYKNGTITINELSNWAILYAGFHLYATEENPMNKIVDNNQTINVSPNEIKKYISQIFGKNIEYIDSNTGISCSTQNAAYVNFDNVVNLYTLTKKGCGGVTFVSKEIPYSLYNIQKYNDRIETIVKTIYVTYEQECIIDNEKTRCYVLYNNQDDKNLIGKYKYDGSTDINSILETTDIFTLYKYTFKYDNEEKNYYFEKIERMK